MEAVPRLPMLSFDLKVSPERTSFGPKLKQYIRDVYHEDPDMYNNEIHALEGLRATAVCAVRDVTGCSSLKRYYCQLHFLQSRFPMHKDGPAAVSFTWRDTYASMVCTLADIRFEMVAILYNIGALHSQLGAADSRTTADGMKMSCTHFQCAAWAFQHLKDSFPQPAGVDLAPDVMQFMYHLSLAQAQECILEKSMMDNRKATIIAKVAVQIVDYYNLALNTLVQGSSDDCSVSETVGSKIYKTWKRYVKFKIAYHSCIALLYQGQQAEEQQKMGERVAYYQAAADKLEEASKLAKGMDHIDVITEALTFTADVVEGKKKAAKNENEFIYHEEVPDRDTLPDVKGASLVKGIPFNVNDPEISGADIFSRLVPMKAHEASSLYSEEKAKLLRRVGAQIDEKDEELVSFMTSLQLEHLNIHSEPVRLPQELVERCAAMSVKPDAIQNLIDSMNKLSDTYHDVESMLQEIKELLQEEEKREKEYQEIVGKRPPSIVATDLTREANKYQEAHAKASESNQTLHKAMLLHVSNLRVLAQPLAELQKSIPTVGPPASPEDEAAIEELRRLVGKVEEMRRQRAMLSSQLRESICQDDITRQLVTRASEPLDAIFSQELQKHQRYVTLVDQNLSAQENILRALTDAYARYAGTRRATNETVRKREATINALISSYDAYEDLLAKSTKGLEFYRKLEVNVSKLLQRIKSACKVQEEEREQVLARTVSPHMAAGIGSPANLSTAPTASNDTGAPKLRDYLQNMKRASGSSTMVVGGYGVAQDLGAFYTPGYPHSSAMATSTAGATTVVTSSPAGSQNVFYDQVSAPSSQMPSVVPLVRPAPVGSEGPDVVQNEPASAKQVSASITNKPSSTSQGTSSIARSTPSASYPAGYLTGTGYGGAAESYPSSHPQYKSAQGNLPHSGNFQQQQSFSSYQPNFSAYPVTSYQMPEPPVSYGPVSYPVHSTANYPIPSRTSAVSTNVSPASTLLDSYRTSTTLSYVVPTTSSYQAIPTPGSSSYYPSTSTAPGSISTSPPSSPFRSTHETLMAPQIPQSSPHPQHLQQPLHPQQPQHLQQPQQLQQPQHQQLPLQQPVEQLPQQSQPDQQLTVPASSASGSYTSGLPFNATNSDWTQQQQQQYYQHYSEYPQYQQYQQLQKPSQYYQQHSQQYYGAQEQQQQQHHQLQQQQQHHQHQQPQQQQQQQQQLQQPQQQQQQQHHHHHHHQQQQQQQQHQLLQGGEDTNNSPSNAQQQPQNEVLPFSSANGNSQWPGHLPPGSAYIPSSAYSAYPYVQPSIASYYTNAGSYPTSQTCSTQQSVEGQTFAAQYNATTTTESQYATYDQHTYYNPPYGYQNSETVTQPTPVEQKNVTYMQARDSKQTTTTTYMYPASPSTQSSQTSADSVLKASNVDLLAGLDFSLNQAPLMPQQASANQAADEGLPSGPTPVPAVTTVANAVTTTTSTTLSSATTPSKEKSETTKSAESSVTSSPAKVSSSLRVCELQDQTLAPDCEEGGRQPKALGKDPYGDPEVLNQFVLEVEKFEKFVEGLTSKTLNGPTPLDIKWKELLDLQEKDAHKRNISVARCYPMKNRFPDILPFDNSRVELPSTKDDYINASFVKDLTSLTPPFILTQAPLQSTVNDFWTMVMEQQVEVVVCLLSEIELGGEIYWPVDKTQDMTCGRLRLSLQSCNARTHWVERILSVSCADTRTTRVVVHLQFTGWPGSSFPPSPGPFLALVLEVLSLYRQQRVASHPVVVHCLSGVGRSGLLCVLAAALLEVQAGRGLLDIVTVAGVASAQRKNCLRDRQHLQFAYQALLYHAQDLLMKRGILTSRSSFDDKRNRGSKCHTRHPSEDFLLGAPADLSQLQSGLDRMGCK